MQECPFVTLMSSLSLSLLAHLPNKAASHASMSFLSQLKPFTVDILRHISLHNPDNLRALPVLLSSFEDALLLSLSNSDSDSLPPTLSSYLFFPFSQFLKVNPGQLLKSSITHQAVFSDVLRVLCVLLRLCPFENGILEQLWTFCALTLGGPLGGKSSSNNNIDTTWNNQVRRAVLSLLETILKSSNDDDQEGEPLHIPGSIVSHTLNSILILAEQRDDYETRLLALQVLETLIRTYLERHDMLPQSLPGTVSTLCKVILASKGNSQVVVRCLACLEAAVRGAMKDERSYKLHLLDEKDGGTVKVASSLEALFAAPIRRDSEGEGHKNWSLTTSVGHFGQSNKPTETTTSTRPGHSKAWLRATASQLHRAIVSLLPVLRNHGNAEVRASFGRFCSSLLGNCYASLSNESVHLLLEELLVLSCDSWEEVSLPARSGLNQLVHERTVYDFSKIVAETLAALPHSIFSNGIANESALQRQLNILTASASRSAFSASSLKIEKWSRTLLRALEFVPINTSSSNRKTDASAPWLQANQSTLFLEEGQADSTTSSEDRTAKHLPPYPALRFSHIAPGSSVMLLSGAIQAVAAACDDSPSMLLEHFINLAGYPELGVQNTASTASALWMVAQLVQGIALKKEVLSVERKERLVRDVVELAKAWLEKDEQDEPASATVSPGIGNGHLIALLDENEDDNLHAIQVVSGTTQLGNLLGPKHRDKSSKSAEPPSFDIHIRALALQLLGVCGSLQEQQFRSHLMRILYPLLRSLSPSMTQNHGLIQAYAYVAIQHISHYCDYLSPAAMIISNVDYILNSISARLRGGNGMDLDPLAPSVLVCVVDLAVEEVLPFLGDAIDEIFDALDRWHAYDLLVSELLRVLDRLVSVCKVDEATVASAKTSEQMQAVLAAQPEREKDFAAFEDWFRGRHDGRRDKILSAFSGDESSMLPENNPQQPFAGLKVDSVNPTSEGDEEDQAGSGTQEANEDGAPATRPQVLILAILRKCLYYIGHPSPFLRARVLSLITTCVPLLANRSSDLLPEVQRFWPYILARLDEAPASSPSYVLLECMRLVSSLMEHKGDFMNLRIISDIWPRIHTVLSSLKPQSAKSDQFTVQHRLLKASIVTMQMAVANVPGIKNGDAWDMAMLFRKFLTTDWDPELRKESANLLISLSKVEADIVWLVLSAGQDDYEDISFLAQQKMDQSVVATVLASVSV